MIAARLAALLAWWHGLLADVHALQLDALHDSIASNLAHEAMPAGDAFTTALYPQLEGQPNGGPTDQQQRDLAEAHDDRWLLAIAPAGFALGLLVSSLCRGQCT